MIGKSIVGDLINFRGLVYAPVNENGVIFLFGKVADDLNMYIEEIKIGFPDCIARRFIGKGWERISIEFEFKSSNFKEHGHDPKLCDIIVCWIHDWADCPIEVIELQSTIKYLENYPIKKPSLQKRKSESKLNDLDRLFSSVKAISKVNEWYHQIFEEVSKADDSIWAKASTKYIGLYLSERSFASLKISKMSIRVECFSRGIDMPGAISSKPRWVAFTVKSDKDVKKAITNLTESCNRIKNAINAGEPTSYLSVNSKQERNGY